MSPLGDVRPGRLSGFVRRSRAAVIVGVLMGCVFGGPAAKAADLEEVQGWQLDGRYPEVVVACTTAVAAGERSEEWRLLLLRALLDTGRVPDAHRWATNMLAADSRSLRLRWAAREAFLAHGNAAKAAEMLEEIQQLVSSRVYSYRDPASLVIFGRSALALGIDPKQVLERIYAPATKADPTLRDVYLARGELALSKSDFALAGKVFDEGLEKLPNDPDLLSGRARAFAEGDREQMILSLEAALKRNPRHPPSLLLMAEHRVDSEDYAGASNLLEKVRSVIPVHPDAAALTAVLAHLRFDAAAEAAARATGLRHWTNNPRVDHLIGRKLSQKYRFAEGAERQRQALAMDPNYLPASAQLASDLLRLGEEAQGWQLAEEVHRRDAYDVAAYNLVTLHEVLTKFVTLTNAHFVVRMHATEAAVYGDRVLELLNRARSVLVPKYGAELQEPTLVEIFHQQKDFGVRTFGMPENPGYLGVCFGRVITANSPATSRSDPVNWEAVLWHEFCHVVTLQMTRNRMPRWFSEGISVHEEMQANPGWGQSLKPRYREMILDGELTPVSRLSAAFLMPKTPMHLQFAYFEAGLLVDFLVGRQGPGVIRQILLDLREGGEINTVLEKRVGPMASLEADFATFAKERALAVAPGLTWNKPPGDDALPDGPGSEAASSQWLKDNPTNFWALSEVASSLVEAHAWEDARAPLQLLRTRYPDQTGPGSAGRMLAQVERALGDTNAERTLLAEVTLQDAAAPEECLRLMALATGAADWPQVTAAAERFLAVNPLSPAPYRALALAAESGGAVTNAVTPLRTLLLLDPPDPAEVHFRLARALHAAGDPGARREVILALEESPRHREALRLLLVLDAEAKRGGGAARGKASFE
ncbi:MAG: hypothetical protein J0L84_04100 [Verrucomicrobia bacterium]|nr:hypothetical protein [Verrucomicrobiota bacterium]